MAPARMALRPGWLPAAPLCVVGARPGRVLLGTDRIVFAPEPLCRLQCRLAENLLRVAAEQAQAMADKIAVVGTKSLRGRVLRFLERQADLRGCRRFVIDFSRAQLADYLGADRTALSRELGRMQAGGLISVDRNCFALCDAAQV